MRSSEALPSMKPNSSNTSIAETELAAASSVILIERTSTGSLCGFIFMLPITGPVSPRIKNWLRGAITGSGGTGVKSWFGRRRAEEEAEDGEESEEEGELVLEPDEELAARPRVLRRSATTVQMRSTSDDECRISIPRARSLASFRSNLISHMSCHRNKRAINRCPLRSLLADPIVVYAIAETQMIQRKRARMSEVRRSMFTVYLF